MKYIKIIAFLFLTTIILSCEKEEDPFKEKFDLGVNILLSTSEISKFDVNHVIELEIINHPDVSVSKIEVESGGSKADATISEGKASFNSSLLGSLEGKESVSFTIDATLSNGKPYKKNYSVSISGILGLSKTFDALTYNSSESDTLVFKTTTKSATVNSVTLDWKKNKAGTYAATSPTGAALEVKADSIYFKNLDTTTYGYGLKIKDTLYYRFIATSGTLKDTLTVTFPVNSQVFGAYKTSSVYSDMLKNKLNLSTATHYADNDADGEGEIVYKASTSGFEKEGTTAIDFVKVGDLSSEEDHVNTSDKFYKEKDLLAIKRVYDADAKTTSVDNPVKDDLYVYKITRDTVTTHGLIKIGSIETITLDSNTSTTLNFEFGEGEIK
jgi:hypothetical protein